MGKDYISTIKDAERRFFTPELRAEDDGMIEGVAAVVNKDTDLGYFKERIAPGAFDNALKDDVVALFNHDPNLPLARTTAKGDGKLELYLTKDGDLGYRFKVPNTSMGKDLSENIRNGVISKSSFAFTIEEDEWQYAKEGKRDTDLRVIKKIGRLYDVSPVTYPAYNDTSVAQRSLERYHEQEEEKEKELRADQYERDLIIRQLDL